MKLKGKKIQSYDTWKDTGSIVTFYISSSIPQNIPITAVKCLFFKEESLLTVKSHKGWDIPGGHLENEETLQECLNREIIEETGCQIKKATLFGYYHIKNKVQSESNKKYPAHSIMPVFIGELKNDVAKNKLQYETTECAFKPISKLPILLPFWSEMHAEIIKEALAKS